MKVRLVEQRIGENMGPIDWSYDFTQHDWGPNRGGVNPEVSAQAVRLLRQVTLPGRWMATVHQCEHDVLDVGMYDGWPFWRPVPSVLLSTPLGSEWHPWYDMQSVRRAAAGADHE